MKKTVLVLALTLAIAIATVECSASGGMSGTSSAGSITSSLQSESSVVEERTVGKQPEVVDTEQESNRNDEDAGEMRLSIGGVDVNVEWEDNQAVADLRALAAEGAVTLELHMYGDFEQVGSLGTSLTASDVQMTTEPGDIVLYARDQISIFYGSNSWAYTKLGHITDRTAGDMADMLGNGNTVITIAIR